MPAILSIPSSLALLAAVVNAQDPPAAAADPLELVARELSGIRAELQQLRAAVDAEAADAPATVAPAWRLAAGTPDSWQLHGWLAQSYSYNVDQPRDGWNGPVTWLDRDGYQFTELYASLRHDAAMPASGLAFGARADLLWGSNHRFVSSAGLESHWNDDDQYGLALPNAFVEVATAGTRTKIGHFVSPVGYVTVGTADANNFFPVLPYTFEYGEPFTHTGFLTTTSLRDDLQIGGGAVNGWDSTADWNSARAGLVDNAWNRHLGAVGTATWSGAATAGDSLAWFGIWSLEPDLPGIGRTSRYLQSLVYSLPLASDVQWVVQTDFGFQHSALPATGPGDRSEDAEWYGLNQFVFAGTGSWRWGAGYEWFRDEDGARVVGAAPSFGAPDGRSFGRGPFRGNFHRLMLGPQWRPHGNVMVRPVALLDWFDGARSGGVLPFDDGTERQQLLFVIDLVLLF